MTTSTVRFPNGTPVQFTPRFAQGQARTGTVESQTYPGMAGHLTIRSQGVTFAVTSTRLSVLHTASA